MKDYSQKTVVVGMSGGVDSSVVACLLKDKGYNVIGIFMKNWDEQDENGICNASKEYQDVIKVCEQIDIPYHSVEFVEEYKKNVFASFIKDYQRGFTPNPDVLCNREIKFKVFYEYAMKLGADYLATGHYCRTENGSLLKGLDGNKDQSYFLYAVKSDVLNNVLFPIGDLKKEEVRQLAKKYNLATYAKKDSTGICFIGERNFREFLANYIQIKPGNFETLDGTVVGTHQGCAFYTLGQRKGLALGGQGEPWFVVGKDIDRNVVIVERGEKHPALFYDYLYATDIEWVSGIPPVFPIKCQVKCRYRQSDQECEILLEDKRLKVLFDIPQRSVTLGQSVVFYLDNICLGGAIISELGPNYFQQNKELPKILGI